MKELATKVGKWRYVPLTARMEHRQHSKEDNQAWENHGVILEMGVHLFDPRTVSYGGEYPRGVLRIGQPWN